MKIAFKAMEDKMKSLMRELKELNMIEKEVEIIDNVVADNNTTKDNKDEDTEMMRVNKKKIIYFYLDICTHKLKMEKALAKQKNTQHEEYKMQMLQKC